jgi:hypothetical protein
MKTIILIFFTLFNISIAVGQTENGDENQLVKRFELKCFYPMLSGDQFVIRNNKDYHKYFTSNTKTDCYNADLPEIDFDKYTLIGISVSTGGCQPPDCEYNYYKENSNSFMEITVVQIGLCKPLWNKYFWFLIPKLENKEDIKITVN